MSLALLLTGDGARAAAACNITARAPELRAAGLPRLAEVFFPWWHRDMQAEFWNKAGLVLLWTQVPWHAPQVRRERRLCTLALRCFTQARLSDPDLQLPERELAELRQLLDADDTPDILPRPEGIGFRRGQMSVAAGVHWKLAVPGYFHARAAEAVPGIVFQYGDRKVSVSSMQVTPIPLTVSPEELLADLNVLAKSDVQTIGFTAAGTAGRATLQQDEQADPRTPVDAFLSIPSSSAEYYRLGRAVQGQSGMGRGRKSRHSPSALSGQQGAATFTT